MPKVLLRLLLTLACWQLTLATLPHPIVSWQGDGVSPERVRAALRALLALNDGELQSLLGGTPPQALAPRVSPSTLLFLAATHRKLQKLKSHLPRTVARIPGDMTIAKRRRGKKISGRTPSPHHLALDPDSLVDAIAHLAEYVEEHREPHDTFDIMESDDEFTAFRDEEEPAAELSRDLSRVLEQDGVVKSRSRRSHNEHHRNAYHHNQRETNSNKNTNINNKKVNNNNKVEKHNCQLHKFHPEFWFRPRACPYSSSSNPLLFCPTPDDNGEWTCIEQEDLCNDRPDCPGAEDELPQSCLFYTPVRDQLEEVFFILSQLQYY